MAFHMARRGHTKVFGVWHALRPRTPAVRPNLRPPTATSFSSSPDRLASSARQSLLAKLQTRYPNVSPSALPSLTVAFLVLHEVTAIVPLVLAFFVLRESGAGEGLVSWAREATSGPPSEEGLGGKVERSVLAKAVGDAQDKTERLARHYGWFGFPKGKKRAEEPAQGDTDVDETLSRRFSGDVANLVGSYLVVKASPHPDLYSTPADLLLAD